MMLRNIVTILTWAHIILPSISQSDGNWKRFLELAKPDCDWLSTKTPPILKDPKLTYNEAQMLEKCLVLWLNFKEAINETTQNGNFSSWKTVLAQPPVHWNDNDLNYGIDLEVSQIDLFKVEADWGNSIYVQLYATFTWKDSRLDWENDKYFSIGWDRVYFDRRYFADPTSAKIWMPQIAIINAHPYYQEMNDKYRYADVRSNGYVEADYLVTTPAECILDYKNYPTDNLDCRVELASYEKGLSFHNGTISSEPKTKIYSEYERHQISKDYDLISMTSSIYPIYMGFTSYSQNYGISIQISLSRRSDIKWIEMFSPLCISVVLTLVALAFPNRRQSLWLRLISILILVITVIGIGHSNYQFMFAHSTPKVLRAYQLVIALTLIPIITSLLIKGAKGSLTGSTAPYKLKQLAASINRFGCAVHTEESDDSKLIVGENSEVATNDYNNIFAAVHVLTFYLFSVILIVGLIVLLC